MYSNLCIFFKNLFITIITSLPLIINKTTRMLVFLYSEYYKREYTAAIDYQNNLFRDIFYEQATHVNLFAFGICVVVLLFYIRDQLSLFEDFIGL